MVMVIELNLCSRPSASFARRRFHSNLLVLFLWIFIEAKVIYYQPSHRMCGLYQILCLIVRTSFGDSMNFLMFHKTYAKSQNACNMIAHYQAIRLVGRSVSHSFEIRILILFCIRSIYFRYGLLFFSSFLFFFDVFRFYTQRHKHTRERRRRRKKNL